MSGGSSIPGGGGSSSSLSGDITPSGGIGDSTSRETTTTGTTPQTITIISTTTAIPTAATTQTKTQPTTEILATMTTTEIAAPVTTSAAINPSPSRLTDPAPIMTPDGESPTMIGQLTLAQYRSRLKNQGERAAVQIIVRGIFFDQLSESQKEAMKQAFSKQISQVAGVDTSAVKDLEGSASAVSLERQSFVANRGALMVNCRLDLPFGKSLDGVEAALTTESAKQRIAQAISRIPDIQDAYDATGDLDQRSLQVGIAESSQDGFFQLDTNFNNALSPSEFALAARTYMNPPLTPEQTARAFAALDSNYDNELSNDEFFTAAVPPFPSTSPPQVQTSIVGSLAHEFRETLYNMLGTETEAFSTIDSNSDGSVVFDELQAAIRGIIGPNMEAKSSAYFGALDTDHNMRITRDEFHSAL